jgi:Family of unknown function (DUF6494)
MNEEVFNLSVRRFLKTFGVAAQREIEKAVDEAIRAGTIKGTETLRARARLEVERVPAECTIEADITLG